VRWVSVFFFASFFFDVLKKKEADFSTFILNAATSKQKIKIKNRKGQKITFLTFLVFNLFIKILDP